MSAIALDINILSVKPWCLKISLIDPLSSPNVAHGYFIFFILGYVLREGMTANNELLSVSDMLVLFKDISNRLTTIN